MIATINGFVLALATFLFAIFYILSLQPAKLEEHIGGIAYARCTTYRTIASLLEVVIFVNYVLFYFFPVRILGELPWDRWISTLTAVILGIPAIIIMFMGIIESGKEGLSPDKSHTMFGGIYDNIRHPQTSGGVLLWFAIAIGSHITHLVLFSIVWIPLYRIACHFEEADLVRRYGQDYIDYQQRVGMFLPKIRR